MEKTFFGVGAPIRDSSGRIVGAVGISGPATRVKPAFMRDQLPEVIAVANSISRALGYSDHTLQSRKTA